MELDLYEIKRWNFPILAKDILIDLSCNPHFMAANILYANFNSFDEKNASWFCVHKDTLFLYEKLVAKFKDNVFKHNSRLKYFHPNFEGIDKPWKYKYMVSRICETLPMSEITFPIKDLSWYYLSANPHKCVIDFLRKHPTHINWDVLSTNSSNAAVDLLLEENKIEWWFASSNTNERIVARFGEHRIELSSLRLSQNRSNMAVQFLLNEGRIDWNQFCKNPNDIAVTHIIKTIRENSTQICWTSLCENTNPRVFDVLRENKDKIVWSKFLQNPICFTYDYEMMRKNCREIKKEIDAMFLRPENVMAMIEIERKDDETDFDVIARLND